ncbi:acyl-CoA dehydrogenase family protein [Pseudonocardia sp. GCM10023141]|uniref:acyl-CoA dehydrogenase family protein n=1 Tax=Pseudonocardia sp. GCM10023141 TaxID=3252653 RepID=UPI00360D4CA7
MSSDVHEQIRAVVDRMCVTAADRQTATAGLDDGLWSDLVDTGFTLLGVPVEVGGSGGDLGDLAVVVEAVARHTAAVPIAETAFVAGWLLGRCGLEVPDTGPLTATPDVLVTDPGGETVSGETMTPWARHAGHLVAVVDRGGERLVGAFPLQGPQAPMLLPGANLAGEPRDTLVFEGCPLPLLVAACPADVGSTSVLQRGALARAIQLGGAAQAVLAMSLRHSSEREQFGRPLIRFPAVQHMLAALAGEVMRMQTSASVAVRAVQAGSDSAPLAVAAAKAATSAAAATVAGLGHQIHGAFGYTLEHRLGRATTRLWSWRDDFGAESVWEDNLADLVLADQSWWAALTR